MCVTESLCVTIVLVSGVQQNDIYIFFFFFTFFSIISYYRILNIVSCAILVIYLWVFVLKAIKQL